MQRAELVLTNLITSVDGTGKPYTWKQVRTVWGKITGNLEQQCSKAPVIYPTWNTRTRKHSVLSSGGRGCRLSGKKRFHWSTKAKTSGLTLQTLW